jgi:hypothetical protein
LNWRDSEPTDLFLGRGNPVDRSLNLSLGRLHLKDGVRTEVPFFCKSILIAEY